MMTIQSEKFTDFTTIVKNCSYRPQIIATLAVKEEQQEDQKQEQKEELVIATADTTAESIEQ